jgi:hypothetical protein
MVHTQRIHPTPLDLQLRCLSQRKEHTPPLSSIIQAISPSSSITNGLVESYTSTSVQNLFKTQACIPMTATYEANEWARPDNPSQLLPQYQRFDADIRRAELNDEELPPFAELESHLLNIAESRGLTLPSQNQRNYNQHRNSARPSFLRHTFQPRQGTTRIFTSRQQQAFSSTMRPYTSHNNRPQQPNTRPNNPSPAQPRPNHDCRPTTHQACPFQQQNCGARPPFRPISSNNTNQRHHPNNNNAAR